MLEITQAVATCAITDLLSGIILIPIVFSVFKADTEDYGLRKRWLTFLIFLTISSLMGFVAHYFFVRETSMKIIWIFLYGMLYETVNEFLFLSMYHNGDRCMKIIKAVIYIIMAVAWIYVEYAEFVLKINPIRVFIIYAFVYALAAFAIFGYRAVKFKDKSARILFCAFIPLIIAGIVQLKRDFTVHFIWDFNEDGIAHILIIISLFIIYASAMTGIKSKKT